MRLEMVVKKEVDDAILADAMRLSCSLWLWCWL